MHLLVRHDFYCLARFGFWSFSEAGGWMGGGVMGEGVSELAFFPYHSVRQYGATTRAAGQPQEQGGSL